MNSKHMMMLVCAAAICGGVQAEPQELKTTEAPAGWNWPRSGETPFIKAPHVSAEVSLAFDAKFMSYGLVDNNDPILTPSVSLLFLDGVRCGVESVFDVSRYGKDAGYGNQAWRSQEVDPHVAFAHAFGPDDAAWLPTVTELALGYMYEAHPKVVDDDTQFFTFAIGLPDLWIEPAFTYELDLARDHGTYLNLELGHTFTLICPRGEGADDVLDFRCSVAQGWGDKKRIGAYLEDQERSGLMDACMKGELTWRVVDGVALGVYVAYSDFLFDSSIREASRHYEATGCWDHSWNFVAGVSFAITF